MFSSITWTRMLSSSSSGVLSGTRILDMTRVLAGPFCSMLLSDIGAEVIKVENPKTGDETRVWGPPFINDNKQYACYYATVNRNKKSIAIDLKQKRGVELVLSLAEKCDVFIENYVPGKLPSIGLGYEHVKSVNPNIIYCSITGFGSTGPYAKRSGYDSIAGSIGGIFSITGPEDGDPCRVGVAITDLTTGFYANSAILAAIIERNKTGVGCKIECNLLSSCVSLLANYASNYINSGIIAKRRGTGHETIVPYQSFKCKDGKFMTIGAGTNQMFGKLCDLIELSHLKNDTRFVNNSDRVENRKILIEIIAEKFIKRSVKEWLIILENSGFPYGPINDIDDVFRDEQVLHNNCIVEAVHPNVGTVRMLGPAVKYECENDILTETVSAPPIHGEHTKEVLKNLLNLDTDAIQSLCSKNVIYCNSTD